MMRESAINHGIVPRVVHFVTTTVLSFSLASCEIPMQNAGSPNSDSPSLAATAQMIGLELGNTGAESLRSIPKTADELFGSLSVVSESNI
jgi:hypothetical protein